MEWDAEYGLHKVSPLLDWTEEQVWQYIRARSLPYNSAARQAATRALAARPAPARSSPARAAARDAGGGSSLNHANAAYIQDTSARRPQAAGLN